jgi:hypothetical protein
MACWRPAVRIRYPPRGVSSVGRAPESHSGGQRFESATLHAGEVPEWSNGHDWKSCGPPKAGSGVRIPPSPPLRRVANGLHKADRLGCVPRCVRRLCHQKAETLVSGHVPKFPLGIPDPFPAGCCRTRGGAPDSLSKQVGTAPTPHTGERQADNALEREPDNRPPGLPEKGA